MIKSMEVTTTDAERSYGVTASEAFEVVTEYLRCKNNAYSAIQKMTRMGEKPRTKTRMRSEYDVKEFFEKLSACTPSYVLNVIALYLEYGAAAKLLAEAIEQANNIKNGVCKPTIAI